MWFALGVLLFFFVVCSLVARFAPHSSDYQDLRTSALRALQANVWELASPMAAEIAPRARATVPVASGSPGSPRGERPHAPPGAKKTTASPQGGAAKRPRVSPFQAKRVAAAQGWRCGCGCVDPHDPHGRGVLLDETFEVDHRVPTRFGGKHDPSNWVAVTRAHHQLKSALESRAAAAKRG